MKTQNLKNSIENLYKTFSNYTLKEKIKGCPCCVGKKENRVLHSKSLLELSGEDLSFYGFKALTTFGDVEDFKHFLPRLFEITIEDNFAYETAILFGKLKYAAWQSWDEKEKSAIKDFFFELFLFAVDFEAINAYQTEDILTGIACAVEDLTPYLDVWLTDITENKIYTLKYFVVDCDYGMSNAFLANQPEKRLQIQNWLVSEKVISILQHLYLSETNSQKSENLSATLETIYQIKI